MSGESRLGESCGAGSRERRGATGLFRLRGWFALAFAGSIAVGLAFHTGMGTYSSWGYSWIASVCPVGALEALATGRVVGRHLLVGIALLLVACILFGRAFCGWACPVPWIERFLRPRARLEARGPVQAPLSEDAKEAASEDAAGAAPRALPPVGGVRDGLRLDSRFVVLAGAFASSALFGFPVFCLVCPVGLAAATIVAIWQLLQFNAMSWDALIFPALIGAEVLLARRWCHLFCPIGAVLSLASSGLRVVRPRVAGARCLRARGIDCRSCVSACPERLDPHSQRIPECTSCGSCAHACPVHAISFLTGKEKGPVE